MNRLRPAAFLVRAWYEDRSFRARVSYFPGLDDGGQPAVQAITADPAELHDQLDAWLATLSQPEEETR